MVPSRTANPVGLNPAAVEAGQRSFQQLCTSCHGANGNGGEGEGQGPNLVNSWGVRRAKDAELFGFIHNGVPGTAMPKFTLPDQKIWELVAYVRSLSSPAAMVPVSGDASAGEVLFFGKAECGSCHKIAGRGGYLGPDLTDAGMIYRADQLREAILDPAASATDAFRAVLLHPDHANAVRGVVKTQSDWSVVVLDEKGELHLLHGPEMRMVEFQNKSWMPDNYGQRLNTEEIEDLVAFLSRQALRRPSR